MIYIKNDDDKHNIYNFIKIYKKMSDKQYIYIFVFEEAIAEKFYIFVGGNKWDNW